MAGDYFASAAKAMLTDLELSYKISWKLNSGLEAKDIATASKVIWKEKDEKFNHGRFYSQALGIISSAQSRQYDRRFIRIESKFDGTGNGIFALLTFSGEDSNMKRYSKAVDISAWITKYGKRKYRSMSSPATLAGWTTDWHKSKAIQEGFEAARIALQINSLKTNMDCAVESMRNYSVVNSLSD